MSDFPADRPILVTTDMSDRSEPAMQRAFALGRQRGARVVALAVVDDAMPRELSGDLVSGMSRHLDAQADALAEDENHNTRVALGDPTEEILRAIDELRPALVVMGVHRRRGFLDALRETTMQRIVRRTAQPVLLVRNPTRESYDDILAALDYSPASTAAIRLAAALCPGARITPVHALDIPYGGLLGTAAESRAGLQAAFTRDTRAGDAAWRRETDLPEGLARTRIETGTAYGVLKRVAEELGAQMICVGAHGRVGAAPAFLGSLASDLMRDPPCDVLIARP